MTISPNITKQPQHNKVDQDNTMKLPHNIMMKPNHVMMKPNDIMMKPHNLMTRPQDVKKKPHNIITKAHVIMMKSNYNMAGPHYIAAKLRNKIIYNHIRQLWHSIVLLDLLPAGCQVIIQSVSCRIFNGCFCSKR